MISILQANSGKNFNRFIEFPHRLYRGDKNYAPPLNLVQKQLLLPEYNPFFRTATTAYYISVDDKNEVTGRIAAIYNKAHSELYKDDTGFFGFFDCVNDHATAAALLQTAADWLKSRGMKSLLGPENPGTNDSLGVLTRGFDRPPVFLMPYNYSYYPALLEGFGLQPEMTLYSYLCNVDGMPDELKTKSHILEKRLSGHGIRIRSIRFKNYKQEISQLQKVYNEANAGNWGFLPLDEKGFFHMANDLKKLVKAEHILIVEKDAAMIGYAVSVPDFNQVFRKIPGGRFFPFGWFTFLRERKKINGLRVMILGILPAYRGLGIDWCLYARIADNARKAGMKWGEACYVMEQNTAMNRMMKTLEAERVKEYQLYKMEI
jgi:GNAT superfamily N-acetyltransferase